LQHIVSRIVCHFFACLVGCVLYVVGVEVAADELSLRGGVIEASELHRRSGTIGLEYRHDLARPFAFSACYTNQGHLLNHHRDGVALQFWAGAEILPRWSVAAGIGPYFYSDTTRLDSSVSSVVLYNVLEQDAHGVGIVYSGAVRWHFDNRWLAELRLETTRARHNVDSTALTLGLGYEFGNAPSAADVGAFQASRNEWTFLAGASVVANNDFKSQGVAATVGYRRMIHPNVEWDISWIHEGVREAARRNGVATELWLVRSIMDDRLVLGAGIGPYVALDFYPDVGLGQFGVPTANRADRSHERLAGLVSMTAAYRFDSRWSARVVWHQVIAREPYDAGVLVFGLGYQY
jgi:hypothetical protein